MWVRRCVCVHAPFSHLPIGVETNYCRMRWMWAPHTKIPYNQLASWSQQKNVKSNSLAKNTGGNGRADIRRAARARSPGVLLHHRHNRQNSYLILLLSHLVVFCLHIFMRLYGDVSSALPRCLARIRVVLYDYYCTNGAQYLFYVKHICRTRKSGMNFEYALIAGYNHKSPWRRRAHHIRLSTCRPVSCVCRERCQQCSVLTTNLRKWNMRTIMQYLYTNNQHDNLRIPLCEIRKLCWEWKKKNEMEKFVEDAFVEVLATYTTQMRWTLGAA